MRYRKCAGPDCQELIEVRAGFPRLYHSDACRQRAYRKRRKERFGSGTGKPLYQHQCQNCGKWFDSKRADAKFHSDSCRVSFSQQMKRLAQKGQH